MYTVLYKFTNLHVKNKLTYLQASRNHYSGNCLREIVSYMKYNITTSIGDSNGSALKPGRVIRVIRVTFSPGHPGQTRFTDCISEVPDTRYSVN